MRQRRPSAGEAEVRSDWQGHVFIEVYPALYSHTTPAKPPAAPFEHRGQVIYSRPSRKLILVNSQGQKILERRIAKQGCVATAIVGNVQLPIESGNEDTEETEETSGGCSMDLCESSGEEGDVDSKALSSVAELENYESSSYDPRCASYENGMRMSFAEGFCIELVEEGTVAILPAATHDTLHMEQVMVAVMKRLRSNMESEQDIDVWAEPLASLYGCSSSRSLPLPTKELYAPKQLHASRRDYLRAALQCDVTAQRVRPYTDANGNAHHLLMPPASVTERVNRSLQKRKPKSHTKANVWRVGVPQPKPRPRPAVKVPEAVNWNVVHIPPRQTAAPTSPLSKTLLKKRPKFVLKKKAGCTQ